MKSLMLIITLSISSCYTEPNLCEIREVLKYVESNNNPKAISPSGEGYGVLQIRKICIDDVNRYYGTDYTHEDAFNVAYSEEIFNLYISILYKRFERFRGREPTEEEIVRSWNGGIYQGFKIDATIPYYEKYKKWSRILDNTEINCNFVIN